MKNLKYFATFFGSTFLLLCFSNCGSAQQSKAISFDKTPPFVIAEIYAQDWVAGVKEGGSGTNVYVTFESLKENLHIETIYFANKVLSVKQVGNSPKTIVGLYKAVSERDIIMDRDVIKEAKNTPERAFPFQLDSNEAVLEYLVDGKARFFKVSDVIMKPQIAYPAAKKN